MQVNIPDGSLCAGTIMFTEEEKCWWTSGVNILQLTDEFEEAKWEALWKNKI
jgi:hypothetical protein